MALGDGITWNEALPDNSTLAHQIDDYNRDLRVGVRNRMAREHVWSSSQTATNEGGHHNFITFQQSTLAPTLSTALTQVGALFVGSSGDGYPICHANSAGAVTVFHNSTAGGGGILVPKGIIVMWSGSIVTIPTGWLICDGTNGTPDLRNRFVVGAGSTYAVAGTGGEATHVLTEAELAAHTHLVSNQTAAIYGVNGGGGAHYDAAGDVASGSAGSGTAHNTLPPYYALAYIQKA